MRTNMKTRLYFSVIFGFYLLISYSSFSQTYKDTSCFPLAIGYRWIYELKYHSIPSYDTISVIDTIRAKGQLYYTVKHHNYSGYFFFRKDNEKIYMIDTIAFILDTSNIRESLAFDFSVKTGGSWNCLPTSSESGISCDYYGKVTIKSKNDTLTTPAGVFKNCYQLDRNIQCRDYGRSKEYFSPGIGRIAYHEESYAGLLEYLLFSSNVITGIEDNHNIQLTHEFKLQQNYPNPFNPSTNIIFSLADESDVKLKIFNSLGQEIATLVDNKLKAGEHKVVWEPMNIANGVYFYRLINEGKSEIKKMLFLK
jgi:hypothetical protein